MMYRQAIPRNAGGFSLLEAIIALTVMATSLMALYAWLSSSALAISRVQANAELLADQRAALAIVESINPMAEPEGERQLESLRVRWHAQPLTEKLTGISSGGGPSAFDLTLYEIGVQVSRNGGETSEFKVRRAGWFLARPYVIEDP